MGRRRGNALPWRAGGSRALRRAHGDLAACVALTTLWWALAGLIGLGGEFPVADDWAYAHAVRSWLETGHMERLPWTWVPLWTHAALGTAFSAAFGFSFQTLRLASFVMGWVGVLGVYALCRQLGARPGWSALGAATLAANPLYVLLSFTFMTDVPFAAAVTWSLVLLVRGLEGRARGWLVAGLGVALLAVGSRQFALPLFPAVALAALWRGPRRGAAAAWALAAGALAFAMLFVPAPSGPASGASGQLAGASRWLSMWMDPHLPYFAARNVLSFVTYLGLFLAPVIGLRRLPAGRARALGLAACGAAGATLLVLAPTRVRMPFAVDLVTASHLGVLTTHGAETLAGAPPALWWTAAAAGLALGLFAAARLGSEVVAGWGALRERPGWLLLVLFPLAYLGMVLPRWPAFDRYLLPVLPALVAVLVAPLAGTARAARGALPLGAALALGLAALATLGTHDYLAHLRARQALLDGLLAAGVPSRCIDGGQEFAGWHDYHPNFGMSGHRWVWDDAFVVSAAAELPGYRAVDGAEFRRWLPPGRESLTVFRRKSGPCTERSPDSWSR